MVIAHLPAGYILTSTINRKHSVGKLFGIGLLGSIFPDLDILYFYLIDNQQTFHRQYITHLPFFWMSITFLSVAFCISDFGKKYRFAIFLFLSNIWLHLCLDTLMAPVYWLHPFSPEGFQLISLNIERRFSYWFWNYLFSPVIILELSFWLGAALAWAIRNKKRQNKKAVAEQDHPYIGDKIPTK